MLTRLRCKCMITCSQDWWWKARLGKCYYQLGLMRDAEKQFRSSLKNQVDVNPCLSFAVLPAECTGKLWF